MTDMQQRDFVMTKNERPSPQCSRPESGAERTGKTKAADHRQFGGGFCAAECASQNLRDFLDRLQKVGKQHPYAVHNPLTNPLASPSPSEERLTSQLAYFYKAAKRIGGGDHLDGPYHSPRTVTPAPCEDQTTRWWQRLNSTTCSGVRRAAFSVRELVVMALFRFAQSLPMPTTRR